MCENGVANPLITIHEVAEKILSNLPLTELLRKRCVCKFWRDCVDRIIRCRPQNVAVTSNFFKGLHDSYYVDCTLRLESIPSEDSNDSPDAYRSPSTRRSKRSRIAAVARNFSSLHLLQSFLKWRESWTSYPQFILMVHKLNVNWVDEEVDESYRKFHDTLVKHIPPSTELIIVRASSDEEFDFTDLTTEIESVAFSAVPMSKIHCFSTLPLEKKKLGQETLNHLKTYFDDTDDVKYFLFFFKKNRKIQKWVEDKLCPMLLQTRAQKHKKLVVTGCALPDSVIHTKISELKPSTSREGAGDSRVFFDDHGSFFSLSFSGDSVQASSLLLDHTVSSQNQLHTGLETLKKSVDLSNCRASIAVLFTCVGRTDNADWYYNATDNNLEINTFHKIFPSQKTLVTLEGYGEIGANFNLNGSRSDTNVDNLVNYQSSIFSIVTFH